MYVINGLFLYRNITGVERYAIEVIKQLDKMISDNQVKIIMPYIPNELPIEGLQHIDYITTNDRYSKINHNIWEQVILPINLLSKGWIGINLCNSSPLFKPDIICIHDIFYKTFPDFFVTKRSRKMAFRRKINYWFAGKLAKKIITVSEFSKKQIVENYCKDKDKVYVSKEGWEHNAGAEPDYSIFSRLDGVTEGNYYFSLGQLSPHKNIKWVFEVAKRNPDQTFVVTGQMNFGTGVSDDTAPLNVIMTGYLSDGEVAALMLEMKALLFPSYCEGFGIPPMEALNKGKKVIMSDRTCLPEIYGKTVSYINPDSYEVDLQGLLSQVNESPKEILDKYTWHKTAQQWKEWLNL